MATPRKGWFRVQNSILNECWPHEVKATAVCLMAYLNTRWARGGLTADEGCEAVIPPAALMQITGTSRLDRARLALSYLEASVNLTVSYLGANTSLRWPKLAETQRWRTLELPRDFPPIAPSAPAPAPAPKIIRSESDSEAHRASKAARAPDQKPEPKETREELPESPPDAPSTGVGAWCPPAETREPLAGSSVFAEAKAQLTARRLS